MHAATKVGRGRATDWAVPLAGPAPGVRLGAGSSGSGGDDRGQGACRRGRQPLAHVSTRCYKSGVPPSEWIRHETICLRVARSSGVLVDCRGRSEGTMKTGRRRQHGPPVVTDAMLVRGRGLGAIAVDLFRGPRPVRAATLPGWCSRHRRCRPRDRPGLGADGATAEPWANRRHRSGCR